MNLTTEIPTANRELRTDVPSTNKALRLEIFGGAVFRLSATPSSKRLVSAVMEVLVAELGPDPFTAQFRLGRRAVCDAIDRANPRIWTDEFKEFIPAIMFETGFLPEENRVGGLSGGLRVRANMDWTKDEIDNADIPRNYHRDTWYAQPQAQVNWWLPLHDVCEDETFSMYPDYFYHPVENSSADIVVKELKEKVANKANFGYSEKESQSLYPRMTATAFDPGRPLRFSALAGDIILFSSHHLHRTNDHALGHTRFNVDFRTFNIDDEKNGLGAPNVDNRSRLES